MKSLKVNWQYTVASLLLFSNLANATSVVVVDSESCQQVQGQTQPFILVLKQGEDLKKAIIECADAAELPGASISGLGAMKNPRLHYYDEKTQQNVYKTFSGVYELISLNGNIAFNQEQQRVAHIHVGLGDHHYQMLGGDLESAEVGVLAEITFIPLNATLLKVTDPKTGFEILT